MGSGRSGRAFLEKAFPPLPETVGLARASPKAPCLSGLCRRFSRRAASGRCRPGVFFRLCYRKWLMLFSLKLQRDNRKNTLAVDPAKGKTGKKLYFSPHGGDETTIYYNRAFFMGGLWGWAWKKAACGEGGKGGPSGAQAAVCLAWRLYASFGADIVHGALAFAPALGGTGAGSICVRARRRHCVKDKV